jgi:N-acetylneuraminate synthase
MSVEPAIEIAGRRISADTNPFLVAELSANHGGHLAQALALLDAAKGCGVDAVKLQTYRPDTITLASDLPDFRIEGGPWDGRTLYDLYEEAHTPWEWHGELFERARRLGLTIFSSPFDTTAIDFLEDLGCPAYKIASFEAVDLPLVRYAAATGKPLIISTGMANAEEISEVVNAAIGSGCRALSLLHCVSGYPAPAEDYNLVTIRDLREQYRVPIGLSDHTLGNASAIASIALGASIVEKHFTLDRSAKGPDSGFSLEPRELAALVSDCRTAWMAMGKVNYGLKPSETANVKFRRSLYFIRAMKAGDVIGIQDVRSVRPGFGLPPKYLNAIVGVRVTRDVAANTAVTLDVLEDPIPGMHAAE